MRFLVKFGYGYMENEDSEQRQIVTSFGDVAKWDNNTKQDVTVMY